MKCWYKNPLIIAIVVASLGWFAYITRSAILSEGKANTADVMVIEERQKQQNSQLCADIADLKKTTTEQTGKIYDLLIMMSGGNQASKVKPSPKK